MWFVRGSTFSSLKFHNLFQLNVKPDMKNDVETNGYPAKLSSPQFSIDEEPRIDNILCYAWCICNDIINMPDCIHIIFKIAYYNHQSFYRVLAQLWRKINAHTHTSTCTRHIYYEYAKSSYCFIHSDFLLQLILIINYDPLD